jgi:hypothetical protein
MKADRRLQLAQDGARPDLLGVDLAGRPHHCVAALAPGLQRVLQAAGRCARPARGVSRVGLRAPRNVTGRFRNGRRPGGARQPGSHGSPGWTRRVAPALSPPFNPRVQVPGRWLLGAVLNARVGASPWGRARGSVTALDSDALDRGVRAVPSRVGRVEDDVLGVCPGDEHRLAAAERPFVRHGAERDARVVARKAIMRRTSAMTAGIATSRAIAVKITGVCHRMPRPTESRPAVRPSRAAAIR